MAKKGSVESPVRYRTHSAATPNRKEGGGEGHQKTRPSKDRAERDRDGGRKAGQVGAEAEQRWSRASWGGPSTGLSSP